MTAPFATTVLTTASPAGVDGPQDPGAGAAVVRAEGLGKTYGSTRAVHDVALSVAPGQIHGLLGPNGAGKSTLLRMLLGLVAPDRGELDVLGRAPFGARGALPGLAGFVDAPRFYPYLTARRNLDLLAALDGPQARGRVDGALESVGLADRARARVSTFSTGMRQRLGLASLLLRDPRVLLLDEPTTGLDPAGVADLHELVRALAARGCAVLLSSHDLTEVEALCGSATILRHGEPVFGGTLSELRSQAGAPVWSLSTSRDEDVALVAASSPSVRVAVATEGLRVEAEQHHLDGLVLALGRAGIAVRRLVRRDTALEALFLQLTEDPA